MSAALGGWKNARRKELDELEEAHRSIGGSGRGRRWATLQLNHAYAAMLSSQFQGFCRDLHSEAAYAIGQVVQPHTAAIILGSQLTTGRKLDSGNPNPGNLGADFGRFGMNFWDEVRASDGRAKDRQAKLEELNTWRNAIAHQNWTSLSPRDLLLGKVKTWRSACNGLCGTFDRVVAAHVATLIGRKPW